MVVIRIASLLIVTVTLISTGVNAYGQIAQVVDANNFCIFLPPSNSADRGISSTEWNAEAFCTGNTPQAKSAGKLASGFITSAHYLATDAYVQVTGQINPSKGRLDPKDDGGQYDIKAPVGSSCAGWKYYVNLVEPSSNTYCMRCCNDRKTCNRGISEKGCAYIIPGDYSGPSERNSTSDETVTTTKTTKRITTTENAASSTSASATTTPKAEIPTTTKSADTTENVASTIFASPSITFEVEIITHIATSTTETATNTNIPIDTFNTNIPKINYQMLSQNEKITYQFINAADNFKHTTVMAFYAILVTTALMISQ